MIIDPMSNLIVTGGLGGLVIQVLSSGLRPDETHCCDGCFLMRGRGAAQTH
jgi:hypothetical protein